MDGIVQVIGGRVQDLGDGFSVRRLLPALAARHVGPVVFFDHFGPTDFAPGAGMDVRPHPHIGLSTLTWLFDGQIRHRDSLGSQADIRAGEVNWMTAGRGIVHSERTPPQQRAEGHRLHGVQLWIALPRADAETAPSFQHHPAEALPQIRRDGAQLVLVAGEAYGERSPVQVFSPMFLLEARLESGAVLEWPQPAQERGVYVIDGTLEWQDARIAAGQMAVHGANASGALRALGPSRLMLFGGAPLDGERHLWWNFVASTRDRIEQAKADWAEGRFATIPGDDVEAIPLPDR